MANPYTYTVIDAFFEYFPEIGAFTLTVSNTHVFISESSFSCCNRSGNSGGAVLLKANTMNNVVTKCCARFCWINSGSQPYQDFGQFIYFSHTNGYSSANETNCLYCSIDQKVNRHGPLSYNGGSGSTSNTNISSCIGYYSSGIIMYEGIELNCEYCQFEDDTCIDRIGPIGVYKAKISARNINFIRCYNQVIMSPFNTEGIGTFSNCYFKECTNFDESKYGLIESNIISFYIFKCFTKYNRRYSMLKERNILLSIAIVVLIDIYPK